MVVLEEMDQLDLIIILLGMVQEEVVAEMVVMVGQDQIIIQLGMVHQVIEVEMVMEAEMGMVEEERMVLLVEWGV